MLSLCNALNEWFGLQFSEAIPNTPTPQKPIQNKNPNHPPQNKTKQNTKQHKKTTRFKASDCLFGNIKASVTFLESLCCVPITLISQLSEREDLTCSTLRSSTAWGLRKQTLLEGLSAGTALPMPTSGAPPPGVRRGTLLWRDFRPLWKSRMRTTTLTPEPIWGSWPQKNN